MDEEIPEKVQGIHREYLIAVYDPDDGNRIISDTCDPVNPIRDRKGSRYTRKHPDQRCTKCPAYITKVTMKSTGGMCWNCWQKT
jgi:hypothetical protein